MPAQILATPTGCTMKSSPLARRWSAWRSQANTNARSTRSRSTSSAASPACSSTTANRSPSRTRWSSVSLVAQAGGLVTVCSSTGGARSRRRRGRAAPGAPLGVVGLAPAARHLVAVAAAWRRRPEPPPPAACAPSGRRLPVAARQLRHTSEFRAGGKDALGCDRVASAATAQAARAAGSSAARRARSRRGARRRAVARPSARGRCVAVEHSADGDRASSSTGRARSGRRSRRAQTAGRARVARRAPAAPPRAPPRRRPRGELAQAAIDARQRGRRSSSARQTCSANSASAGPHAMAVRRPLAQQRVGAPPGGRVERHEVVERGRQDGSAARPSHEATAMPSGASPAAICLEPARRRSTSATATSTRSPLVKRSPATPAKPSRRRSTGLRAPPSGGRRVGGAAAPPEPLPERDRPRRARAARRGVGHSARRIVRGSTIPFQRLRSRRSAMSWFTSAAGASAFGGDRTPPRASARRPP